MPLAMKNFIQSKFSKELNLNFEETWIVFFVDFKTAKIPFFKRIKIFREN